MGFVRRPDCDLDLRQISACTHNRQTHNTLSRLGCGFDPAGNRHESSTKQWHGQAPRPANSSARASSTPRLRPSRKQAPRASPTLLLHEHHDLLLVMRPRHINRWRGVTGVHGQGHGRYRTAVTEIGDRGRVALCTVAYDFIIDQIRDVTIRSPMGGHMIHFYFNHTGSAATG